MRKIPFTFIEGSFDNQQFDLHDGSLYKPIPYPKVGDRVQYQLHKDIRHDRIPVSLDSTWATVVGYTKHNMLITQPDFHVGEFITGYNEVAYYNVSGRSLAKLRKKLDIKTWKEQNKDKYLKLKYAFKQMVNQRRSDKAKQGWRQRYVKYSKRI